MNLKDCAGFACDEFPNNLGDIKTVEKQDRPSPGFPGYLPMDTAFPRFILGTEILVWGNWKDPNQPATSPIELYQWDAASPNPTVTQVTNDSLGDKVAPYGFRDGTVDYLLAGVDNTSASVVMQRPAGSGTFAALGTFDVAGSGWLEPKAAASHEPVRVGSDWYAVWQVHEGATMSGSQMTTPAEVWYARVLTSGTFAAPVVPVRIAGGQGDQVATEPEPIVPAVGGEPLAYYNVNATGQSSMEATLRKVPMKSP